MAVGLAEDGKRNVTHQHGLAARVYAWGWTAIVGYGLYGRMMDDAKASDVVALEPAGNRLTTELP